ncbi:MAG: VOC family protein [Dehalococcoidia bacterium]
MLTSAKPIAFVATARSEEAKAFYEGVLGLRLVSDEPFAIVFDCAGVMLRVQKANAVEPAPYTVLGWHVDDIGATMAGLKERGVSFEQFPWMPQDSQGVWEAPGGGKIAWFKDPDGNVLSLTQSA